MADTARRPIDELLMIAGAATFGAPDIPIADHYRDALHEFAEAADEARAAATPMGAVTSCAEALLIEAARAVWAYPHHQQPLQALRAAVELLKIYRDPLPGPESKRWDERYGLMGGGG